MIKKILLTAFLFLFIVSPVFAQDTETGAIDENIVLTEATTTEEGTVVTTEEVDVTAEIREDETISSEELGIAEPIILPDSPFYFIREWNRGLQLMFTFNNVKKAELQLRFTDERLKEAEKLAEKTGNEEILTKAIEKYEQATTKLEERATKLQNSKNADTDKFLNKLTNQQIKHQKLIDGLVKKLPEQIGEKIEATREKSLERFVNVIRRLDSPEKLEERLDKMSEIQEGSKFKNFKNLEVLSKIEEKLPEQAREAVQKAQENALKRLNGDLSNMSPEDQEKFRIYISKMEGNELGYAEIIDRLESKDMPEELRVKIEEIKENVIERARIRIESMANEDNKEEYLKRLEEGNINKLRILNQLGDVMPEAQQTRIEAVKTIAINKLNNKIEGMSDDEKESLLKKIEISNDAKTFRVIDDLRNGLPENKREFVEKMEERAIKKLESDFGNANDEATQERVLERISGNSERHIQVLQRVQNNVATSAQEVIGRVLERTETRTQEWEAKKICATELKPVCAIIEILCFKAPCDPVKKTFPNACLAKATGATSIYHEGSCEDLRNIPLPEKPVSAGTTDAQPTSDKPELFCTTNYKPVCGINEKTYSNECVAKNAGIKVKYTGECKQTMDNREMLICTTDYKPVCGADGKTYPNACNAKNAGVIIKYERKCEIQNLGDTKPQIQTQIQLNNPSINSISDAFIRKCNEIKGVVLESFPPQCKLPDGRIVTQ